MLRKAKSYSGLRARGTGSTSPLAIGLIASALLILLLTACGPSAEVLAAVDYAPLVRDDWPVSTPEAEGLDPALVAELYYNAAQLETVKSVLVIKNGKLVAEDYFNGGTVNRKGDVQSVTKSYTSALVGLALEEGCLSSVNQKMMAFFPELEGRVRDPRKNEITIRHLLQMRAGYAWEESSAELFEILYTGFRPATLLDVPLISDPGTDHDYSNLSSHLLGLIVARACETDLKSFAEEHLFTPLGIQIGSWGRDWEGNYLAYFNMHFTARDMGKFGQMFLDDGEYGGRQVVPAEWVHDSLAVYSEDAWPFSVGRNFKDISYGYQWWSIRAGDHRYNLAWGHGGQQIALLDEYDMLVVVTADPLVRQHGDEPWRLEKANLNLVADFIASLPSE